MNPIRVLFVVQYLYHWPHFAPIWQRMQSADFPVEGYATFAGTDLPEAQALTQTALKNAGLQLITGETEEKRFSEIASRSFDLAFVGAKSAGFDIIRQQTTVVCSMAHGLGTKEAYFKDSPSDADIRFTEGPQHHNALKKRYPNLNLVLTGMSKLDPLFDGSDLQIESKRRQFHIDPDRPVILWAPTFYPSSLEVLHKAAAKLAQAEDFQWIIKPHHFTYFPRQWKYKRQKRLVTKLEGKSENILLLPPEEYSILPWLQIADILLSDTSSVLFEMVAIDKPVIQCDKYGVRLNHRFSPDRLYKRRLDKKTTGEFDYAIHIDSADQLPAAIWEALDDPEWLINGRSITRENLFYRLDGHASDRIVAMSLELLNEKSNRSDKPQELS